MKVRLARTAGFCMGVRRAMELLLAEVNRGENDLLCTYDYAIKQLFLSH